MLSPQDPDTDPDTSGDPDASVALPAATPLGGLRFLGDFRILREVGRGGMGIVYEAIQESLGRRVALKVLPSLIPAGPDRIERFRREAAAAARLNHPGIVPVFHVDQTDGHHYFAMEFVDGPSVHALLQEVIRKRRDFASGYGDTDLAPGLGQGYLNQAAALCAQAAEALAAAHAAGIVHRDVKPQNLLVDGGDKVRLVDFGLAKDLDRETISQSRNVAGTPQYMSPEQAQGLAGIDARTDVYSLGVVLYELLALRCPFDAPTTQALLYRTSHEEPPRLRKLSPKIPADLAIVCHRAIERDPDHRYAGAAEMAADLRRFLAHKPIVAQPPSVVTRLVKLARRRRASTVAVVALVLLTASIGGLAFAYFQQEEGRRADFQRLRSVLVHNLDRADEWIRIPGMQQRVRDLLQETLPTLEQVSENAVRDTGLRIVTANAWSRLGALRIQLGDHELGSEQMDRGVETLRQLHEELPEHDQVQHHYANALTTRAQLQSAFGTFDHLIPDVEAALSIHRGLVARKVQVLDTLPAVAYVVLDECTLGSILALKGDLNAGVEHLESGVQLLGELPTETLADPSWRAQVMGFHGELGRCLAEVGRPKEAVVHLEQGLARLDALTEAERGAFALTRQCGTLSLSLANARRILGDQPAADAALARAEAVFQRLTGEFPDFKPFLVELARCAFFRGQGHLIRGQKQEGFEAMLRARSFADRLPEAEPVPYPYLAIRSSVHGAIATLLLGVPTTPPAEIRAAFDRSSALLRLVVLRRPLRAASHFSLASSMHNFGHWLSTQNESEPATRALEEAIVHERIALERDPANKTYHQYLCLHHLLLAKVELERDRLPAADAALRGFLAADGRQARMEYQAALLAVRLADKLAGAETPASAQVEAADALAVELLRSALDHGVVASAAEKPQFSRLKRREDYRAALRNR